MRLVHSFAFLLIMVALTTGCASESGDADVRNSVTYGLTLDPSGIDPHIHSSSELGIVLRQVYDTLVYRDPETLDFVPGLADTWSISDDGLVYTFTLRQGITFHDGTAFDASSVGANLDRIAGLGATSQRAIFMLGPYSGYQIIDDYTISIILEEPYAPLLDALSQVYLGMASPVALAEYSDNRYQFHQVGTGPFRFVEYLPGDRIVLRRNQDYAWGPRFYQLNADAEDSLDEIIFRFYVDEPTRRLALESGDVQIIGEMPPPDARSLTGNSNFQVIQTSIPGQPMQFIMNTNRFPTDNIIVRRALVLATNRSTIVDVVYQGFSPVAWGPITPSTLYYAPGLVGVYEYDPQQARDLLSSVGFEDTDNDGFLNIGEEALEITILVPPWSRTPQVAELIQDQWRDVGIRVRLQSVPGFNGLIQTISEGEYNLVAFDTSGLDPEFLENYFASEGPNNWTGFSDPQLDALMEEAVRERDTAVRRRLFTEIQGIIMDQVLILPVRSRVNLNVASSNIEGLRFDAYGWFPILNDVRLREG